MSLKSSVLTGIVAVALIVSLVYVGGGIGQQRSQSQYTGHVVDVVEDKGLLVRPTWVNMKTDPRSSDIQSYCILPEDEDELLPKFYSAMEDGDRYTVTYERPLFVSPLDCQSNQAIITDIQKVNNTNNDG